MMFDRFEIKFAHRVENEDGVILRVEPPLGTFLKVDQSVGYKNIEALKFLADRLAQIIESAEKNE